MKGKREERVREGHKACFWPQSHILELWAEAVYLWGTAVQTGGALSFSSATSFHLKAGHLKLLLQTSFTLRPLQADFFKLQVAISLKSRIRMISRRHYLWRWEGVMKGLISGEILDNLAVFSNLLLFSRLAVPYILLPEGSKDFQTLTVRTTSACGEGDFL